MRYALYATLFPHLVAGPIVRYRDIASQLAQRVVNLEMFASGVRRLAVGLGKKEKNERVALDVKAGDTILFGKYSGQDIKLDGEEYLIMREDEVLAVLDSK